MEQNKNFDNETHCYFNEDTQEWIPYYQLESYQIKEQTIEQWGTMSNKEIKAMNGIEQPTLF
jgi:hypothetical protein